MHFKLYTSKGLCPCFIKKNFKQLDMNSEWNNILKGCSKREAYLLLILQSILYAIYSIPFFYIFTLGISIACNLMLAKYGGRTGIDFTLIMIIHTLCFFLYKNLLFARHLEEMNELKRGIQQIKNYIHNKSWNQNIST